MDAWALAPGERKDDLPGGRKDDRRLHTGSPLERDRRSR
jgi:hypothetical protein